MSKYTTASADIYFLNDKNIVSSFNDVPTCINPIPSFDIVSSGYAVLTSFKRNAMISVDGLCADLKNVDSKIAKHADQVSELCAFKGAATASIKTLSVGLEAVSSDTSANTYYLKDLIGLDQPYSGGKIKALSDDVEALKGDSRKTIKFRKTMHLAASDASQDFLHMLYVNNILTQESPTGYVMNGTLVNVFVDSDDASIPLQLKTAATGQAGQTIHLGNGDILIFHVDDSFMPFIYANSMKLVERLDSGNIYLVKSGVSMYDLRNEMSARASADMKLSANLSNDILTKELKHSEVSSIADISASCGKSDWNNGDIIIVKKHLFAEESRPECEYASYVFKDGAFYAMDGNVNADNVYFNHSFTLAGNYKTIGNISKADESTISSFTFKDNVTSLFAKIFSKHEDPKVLDQPTLALAVKNGTAAWPAFAEVGTTISPMLSASLTRGRYTPWKVCSEETPSGVYRQNKTNVSKLTCAFQSTYDQYETQVLEDPDTRVGSQLTANTSIVMPFALAPIKLRAGKNCFVKVTPSYNSDINAALDNEGKPTSIKVNATTAEKTTAAIVPYYKAFYGSQSIVRTFVADSDVSDLRSIASVKSTARTLAASTLEFTTANGTRQLVVALPQDDAEWKVTKLYDATAYATIAGVQGPISVKIKDAGSDQRNYKVWHVDFGSDIAGKMDGHKIQVTVGN